MKKGVGDNLRMHFDVQINTLLYCTKRKVYNASVIHSTDGQVEINSPLLVFFVIVVDLVLGFVINCNFPAVSDDTALW
jgi:hypothetical protein